MAKLARTYRLHEDLIARFEAEAKRRGQTYTVFLERALEAALSDSPTGAGPSADKSPEGSGASHAPRSAASPRTSDAKPSWRDQQGIKPIPKGGKG